MENDGYGGGSVVVWLGVSIDDRSDLHVIDRGTMTTQRYPDKVLDPIVRPLLRLWTGHQSLDLNPIENLWDILYGSVQSLHPHPHEFLTVRQALVEEWQALP